LQYNLSVAVATDLTLVYAGIVAFARPPPGRRRIDYWRSNGKSDTARLSPGRLHLIDQLRELLPGVALCIAITVAAILLQGVEVRFAGQAYLEALVLALLIGVALRTAWKPGPRWDPGIRFSAKTLLEVAIVMLGASVSATTLFALGPVLIFGIAGIVAVAIGTSYAICRALGLPLRLSILVACGNSICGNSAIAAVAPVIGADGDDIASSISFTAVLGVVVVLGLPFLVPVLQLSLTQYGVLAGLTVYAVPQVLAATLPIGALSNQVGTVIKLVRVLMLGPVVLGISLFARELRAGSADRRSNNRGLSLGELVPWFIVGFLVVLIVRSLGVIPPVLLPPITQTAAVLTTLAMAALGLGVDVRVVAQSGLRVTAAVTVSLIALGAMSYLLIRLTGIP
jgi:uncharacterized integral membrane protein (TIGR00698 family)